MQGQDTLTFTQILTAILLMQMLLLLTPTRILTWLILTALTLIRRTLTRIRTLLRYLSTVMWRLSQ
jgi:hypothetical protein